MKKVFLFISVLFSLTLLAQEPVEKGKFRDVSTPIDTLENGSILYGEFLSLSITNYVEDDGLGVVFSKITTTYRTHLFYDGVCLTCDRDPVIKRVSTTDKTKIEQWDATLGDIFEQSIKYDILHNEGKE